MLNFIAVHLQLSHFLGHSVEGLQQILQNMINNFTHRVKHD